MSALQTSFQNLRSSLERLPDTQRRVVTAVIGGTLFLGLALAGGRVGVTALALVISLGMLHEFSELMFHQQDKTEKRYVLLIAGWFSVLLGAFLPRVEFEILIFSFISLFAFFMFTSAQHTGDAIKVHFKELMAAFFGLFYLGYLVTFLPKLNELVHGSKWILVFLVINWLGDSGAYFAGRKYGKTKLLPLISPKKTREGAWAGLGVGLVGTLIIKLTLFREMPWLAVLVTPVVVGVVAQLGDLLESFLKRAFEVKDSGSLLPGHGGFLDRFDGFVISLPVMYACVRIFT